MVSTSRVGPLHCGGPRTGLYASGDLLWQSQPSNSSSGLDIRGTHTWRVSLAARPDGPTRVASITLRWLAIISTGADASVLHGSEHILPSMHCQVSAASRGERHRARSTCFDQACLKLRRRASLVVRQEHAIRGCHRSHRSSRCSPELHRGDTLTCCGRQQPARGQFHVGQLCSSSIIRQDSSAASRVGH